MKGQRKERKEIENMMCPHALIFEKEKTKKTFPLSHHSLLYRRVVGLLFFSWHYAEFHSCYLLIQAGIKLKGKNPCLNSFCD